MNKYWLYILLFLILTTGLGILLLRRKSQIITSVIKNEAPKPQPKVQKNQTEENSLNIKAMKKRTYPGSSLIFEQTLNPESNYQRYIVSYQSDGLKIYGLLTVPNAEKPVAGYPAIIFNHGFIPPETYQTRERYVAYVNALAKEGYVVFKPDFRGHGDSQGQPEGAYYSPAYATDDLNALASLKIYDKVNPKKIGMWGHSMGGNITLRDLVVNGEDIKAAVIWGGVVGTYEDLMNNWQRKVHYQPPPHEMSLRNNYRKDLLDRHGTPLENPVFWQSIDPNYHLSDITTPIQLHTGGNDEEVPVDFSLGLKARLEESGKTVEYYNYPGGDHNIASPNFEIAMKRSIEFFNRYLKRGGGDSK